MDSNAVSLMRHKEFMDVRFLFEMFVLRAHELNKHWHAHDYYQLVYVSKGACVHHLSGKRYVVGKGDLIVIPPYAAHKFSTIEKQLVEIAQFDLVPEFVEGTLSDDVFGSVNPLAGMPILHDLQAAMETNISKLTINTGAQVTLESLIDGIRREYNERQIGYQSMIRADVIKMLVWINREARRIVKQQMSCTVLNRRDRRLQETICHINEHYEDELKLEEMARMADLAPGYFSFLFKQATGKTFVEYINYLRIHKSMQLIRDSDMKIIDIFMSVGFNHIGHFNRMFRKITGVTPSQFRKQFERDNTEDVTKKPTS